MSISKVFKSGNSQAFRIPKEMQTTEEEFIVTKVGNCYCFVPTNDPWAMVRQCIGAVDEDVSFDRNQPPLSEISAREEF